MRDRLFYLLQNLTNTKNRIERRGWIIDYLKSKNLPYAVERFAVDGANILIKSLGKNSIVFSAHYDGDSPNDNLACVAILLYILENYSVDNYAILLTDLEEEGAKGIKAYIREHGTNLPIIVLELCGCGKIIHIGESSFVSYPPFNIVRMDEELLEILEKITKNLRYRYRRYLTPPGDHLHYSLAGGRCALLSIVNEADFEIILRMSRQVPPHQLFNGIDKNQSVISKIPPFGECKIDEIMPESLERIYNILVRFLEYLK